ncbi:MAG: DNA cytosine methyltransferase [Termitinemataceae bacterium]|nr:MAG: DNA cytosine methyltransferase [Termitinemataceae bacterium]
MDNHKKNYIDLFAGCGGLSLGLHLAGWQGLFAVEKSPFAFETLKYNLIDNKHHFDWPEWLECRQHDIYEVLKNHKSQLLSLRGKIDLVAGGPPCQGFSTAGKRIENDVRNKLVYSYVEFINLVRPHLILFENVKGFTYAFPPKNKDDTPIPYSKIVIEKLHKMGYDIKSQIIDLYDYGVPQIRKRFILVGSLNNNASEFIKKINARKLDFLHNKGLLEKANVADAISDLLQSAGIKQCPDRKGFYAGVYAESKSNYQKTMREGYARKNNIPDSHSFAHHNETTQKLFSTLLSEYPFRNKKIANNERKQWNIKKRGITILDANAPCPTLTTHPDDYIHYSEPRILTVREYARIQSFPDWYEIKKKYTTGGMLRKKEVPRYTQIGNAIPPLFAEQAGLALKDML